MSTNALIQTSRTSINDIVSKFRDGSFFVDNTFQRKLVWTEKQKARLIETILMGYPMPELYLWQQPADAETGIQKHSIVDGQQRITTLVQFVSNEWMLKRSYLDVENQESSFVDKFWKDLPAAEKQNIWNYVINARVIPNTVTDDSVRTMFMRLNETDKSLNPQELRNAEFNGEFIKTAEQITDNEYWKSWRIFTESQVRRMADIQLASSLLIFLRQGVVGDTTESLNSAYDLYNDIYEEKIADFNKVVEFIVRAHNSLLENDATRTFFTKPIHFYTLFCVDSIVGYAEINLLERAAKLNSFVQSYEANVGDTRLDSYRVGSSSRTRSKASRDRRVNALIDWLIS